MRLPGLAIGFAPWMLFLVMPHSLDDDTALLFAGALSTAVAVVLTWWTHGRTGIKMLSAAAVPTFAAVTAFAWVGTDSARAWLSDYGAGAVLLVLALLMFATVPSAPFTEQYAREALPDAYWHAPHLHRINTRISMLWASACLACAFSVTCAAVVTDNSGSGGIGVSSLTLQWLVPVLLALTASRYTAAWTRIERPAEST